MTCELNDAEVWLKSALPEESGKEVSELLYNVKVQGKYFFDEERFLTAYEQLDILD